MKIGLSFSLCVKDVLEGKVPISEVLAIISGTKMENEKSWEYVIETYSQSYWRDFSDPVIKGLVDTLRQRIIQPRLYDIWPPPTHNGYWIEV